MRIEAGEEAIKMSEFKEYPDQCDYNVKRWLENEDGEIISVVDMHYNPPSRLGIDGEIRCSLVGSDSFAIPCSLNMVAGKSTAELIKVAKRQAERRNRK